MQNSVDGIMPLREPAGQKRAEANCKYTNCGDKAIELEGLPSSDRESAQLFNKVIGTRWSSEAEREAMLKSILNGMEAHIAVCVPGTGEILFLNKSIREYFSIEGDGVGKLCYKLLQARDEPCENCPYLRLFEEPDKVVVREQRDAIKGRIHRKTSRFIDWPGGAKAYLEYAIDVTELMGAQEALEHRDAMLYSLNNAAILLLSQFGSSFRETLTLGTSLIADIANIDRMSISRNVEKPDGLYATQIYRWEKKRSSDILPVKGELSENPYSHDIPRWEGVLSAGECINGPIRFMPEYETLKRFGCLSVLAIPVAVDGRFWGFVLYEDLVEEKEFTPDEVDLLRSASFMLVNSVIRNEEAERIREGEAKLQQMIAEVEYQNKLLHTVNSISAVLLQSNADTFEADMIYCMGVMAEASGADRAYIWENYTQNGEVFCNQIYEWSGNAEPQQGKDLVQGVSYSEVVPSWLEAFEQRRCINSIVRDLPVREHKLLRLQGVKSILAVPIYLKERLWGFVGFDDCHSERRFTKSEEEILRSASELIANALIRNGLEKNILQLEGEVDKIFYDPLTGIYNRRFFDENLRKLIRSLSRSDGLISLMMIDIDYFKRFNDSYGHVEGDNCLKAVAESLRGGVTRADDFVARYGGEEFAVVLPNTDEAGARIMARKLMEGIRALGIKHENSGVSDYVTVSIGVMTGKAEHNRGNESYIHRADQLLYQSKQGGRNRYTFGTIEE